MKMINDQFIMMVNGVGRETEHNKMMFMMEMEHNTSDGWWENWEY